MAAAEVRGASDKQVYFLKERLADANMNISQAMFCLSAMSHIMNEAKSIPLNMLLRHISQMREQITEMEGELGVVRDDIVKAETAMGGVEARSAAVMDAVDVADAFFERQTARLGLAVDLPRGWTLADKHRTSALGLQGVDSKVAAESLAVDELNAEVGHLLDLPRQRFVQGLLAEPLLRALHVRE